MFKSKSVISKTMLDSMVGPGIGYSVNEGDRKGAGSSGGRVWAVERLSEPINSHTIQPDTQVQSGTPDFPCPVCSIAPSPAWTQLGRAYDNREDKYTSIHACPIIHLEAR